ncbi:SymE family type I addiction module toxin [Gilliamella sp. B2838]|uniref:SymE family type I addiction module toxin n=1 Tax=Gilliamella sp. B2838 TaxID=2818020 RepID=UPI003A5CBA8A
MPVSNRFLDLSAVEARWFYTVGYMPQGTKSNPRLQLTIKDRWLEQFGFYTGQPVIIKIEQGKLIIELAMQI